MKRGSTLILKVTLFLIAIPILAICLFGLPMVARDAAEAWPNRWVYPVICAMYVSVFPYLVALYQAFRLLSYIDKNHAFSELSVRALKIIKYCALLISVLYTAVMPFIFFIADLDDAPGLILIGLVVIFASFVIAVFAAVLQMLLQDAIDIKSENDLTV